LTDPVTLGFGDETQAGLIRSDAGALLLRGGETTAEPTVRVEASGAGWRASDEHGLELAFEPLGEPAVFSDGTREWLCRARGETSAGAVDCLGQAVVAPPPPRTWKRFGLTRAIAAWLDDELAITLRARRPARAKDHEAEEVESFVLRGAPPAPHAIDDPRLSTAYAGDGRHRRAGLELWESEEADYALRLAGEAIGEGTLDLPGGMRLHAAFFAWRHDGGLAAGRYDILRPD
jgi:hypothetical protein